MKEKEYLRKPGGKRKLNTNMNKKKNDDLTYE